MVPFSHQKAIKMASEIDHPSYIDCNLDFSLILNPFWDQFWNHFGDFGCQNGGTLTGTTLFGWLLAQLLPLRRLGDPVWDDFGSILEQFFDNFRSKNGHRSLPWLLNQPANQPISQPINQPTNRSTNQPTNQSANQPANQPFNQPNKQPINQPITQPIDQPANQPTNPPINEPTNHPTNQSPNHSTNQPGNQQNSQLIN